MHRSIMQNLDNHVCFLCHSEGAVEAHHCIHGTANRRLAEQDGLIVNLCPTCHRKVHDHGLFDDDLMCSAEMSWINYNNSDITHFIARYGKNYL